MSSSTRAVIASAVAAAAILAACASEDPAPAKTSPGYVSLDGGAVKIPKKNVGSVDLTKLPLGDGKYTTAAPKRGWIYTCNAHYMPARDNDTLESTGVAGLSGKLPGVEPRPYIIRFTSSGFSEEG